MIWPRNDEKVREHFKKDIENLHLLYDYDAENPKTGAPEKWRYEMWFHSEDRIVYAIHGGPMAGRLNYQKADYQCIRPGELYQVNWLEETGTICSLVYDIKKQKITTMLNFSKGHWQYPEKAHGDKRNPEDFQRWRDLAKIGVQTDRHILNDQATILETFHGAGDLQDIDLNAATL
ncbi:hypothetical protein NDA11_003596 [Ustilago hordei]|uniref:Phenol acid carboxylase n=1 Tax=Ustilago hordei TaxID=120017 RepID=I2FWW1_USTHO|nr:uncharacterized protein UHO2_04227 [Ustilago hordei]KAJ1037131.1 hypothetical protein NDA10_004814 [Ustilago hordei]KAJ1573903.1 hypothetical protein NDA15_007137 [Ustilago hordei]KAJ1579327.1 hypothetical protein NDA11_003596 [Ustilago hordei]KAJ1579584.1 hypothetical protein NDA12_001883 [Ustilago hordei]KAJ1598436.1 hypothetical protein NDA14_000550 [Ustilago hordei]